MLTEADAMISEGVRELIRNEVRNNLTLEHTFTFDGLQLNLRYSYRGQDFSFGYVFITKADLFEMVGSHIGDMNLL